MYELESQNKQAIDCLPEGGIITPFKYILTLPTNILMNQGCRLEEIDAIRNIKITWVEVETIDSTINNFSKYLNFEEKSGTPNIDNCGAQD